MPRVSHPWWKHFCDARFIIMEVDTSVMIILVMSWNTSTTAQVWLSWFFHKIVMDVHAWQKTWPTVTNTYHHGSVFFCSVGGSDFGEPSLSHLEDYLPLDSSDCCTQTIWVQAQRLRFSPLVCRLRNSLEVSYLLTWALAWNPSFSPWNIPYVPRRFKNRLRRLNSKPFNITKLSRSHQNVYVRCSQHPQTTFEVQHTEWCIKDISLLRSNEDNPQFTDPVYIIATINFQLNFL